MTITITASTFTLSGPLVAGERVGVSVSGFSFEEGVAPVLTLSSRFPAALLASVELSEDEQTTGTWTGELDTATKGTGAFMMTARADERRDAVLELVAGRDSLARLSVPLVNSALCPRPPRGADTSPVFVPGPQGDAATVEIGETTTLPAGSNATVTNTGTAQAAVFNFGIPRGEPGGSDVEPSETTPLMDGTGAAGASGKYARGDHQHPSDTSRVSLSGDTMTGPLSAPVVFAQFGGGFVVWTNEDLTSSISFAPGSVDGVPGSSNNSIDYKFEPVSGVSSDSDFSVALNGLMPINFLLFDGQTTLSTAATVYRATATGGVIPTVDVSGIPTCNAYFAFELEISVPAGATLDASALSSWNWLDGGELPTSDYAGKTLYIAARLDCTANVRTVLANCWRVVSFPVFGLFPLGSRRLAPLPYDAEVEYVESTGAQYVDTGVRADSNLGYDIACEFAGGSASHIGAISNAGAVLRHHFGTPWYGTQTGVYIYFYNNGVPVGGVPIRSGGNRFVVDTVSHKAVIDSVVSSIPSTPPFDVGGTFWVCARNGCGSVSDSFCSCVIYSAKFYVSGVLVRDFAPVRVGTAGYLYDRANPTGGPLGNGLYGSATATPLVAGPDKNGG